MSVNSSKLSQESVTEDKNIFQALSPVFKVYQNRGGKKRKKISQSQTSESIFHKEDLDKSSIKFKSLRVNEELYKSSENCEEVVSFEDDGELLNSSFTQLDKVCNNLLNGKQKSDDSKFSKSFADVFLKKKNKKLHFDYLQFSKSLKINKQFYAKTISTKVEHAKYNISDLFLDCFNVLEIVKENDKDNLKSYLHEKKLGKNCQYKYDKKEVTTVKNLEMEPVEALQKKNLFLELDECKNNHQVPSKLALELSAAMSSKSDLIGSKKLSVFEEFKKDVNDRFDANKSFIVSSSLQQLSPAKLCNEVEQLINNNNQVSSIQQICKDEELPFSNVPNIEPSDVFGFSTASGVKLSASKKSLERAQKLMAQCNENEDFQNKNEKSLNEVKLLSTSGFYNSEPKKEVGFSTASGVKLSATKKSLERAQKLMVQWNDDEGFQNLEMLDVAEMKPLSNSSEFEECLSKITNTSTPLTKVQNFLLDDLNSQDRKKFFSNSFKNYNFHTPLKEVKTPNSIFNLSIENHDNIELSLSHEENRFKNNELDVFHSSNEKSHSFALKAHNKGLKRAPTEFDTPTKKIKYLGDETNGSIAQEVFNVQEKRAVARFNQEIIIEEKKHVNCIEGSLLKKKIFLRQNRKKNLIHELFSALNITEDMFINLSDAANYKFLGPHFFGSTCNENVEGFMLDDFFNIIPDDEGNFGVEEFKRGFLAGPGIQPNLIPKGWIENHYKWIIWKLVYYKKAFQNCLLNVLTPNNVMLQLKYRYDREIDRSERSALKKILEKDDTSAKRIVLRICEINKDGLEYQLNLSDGWYSCPAKIDLAMVRLIEKGKIKVGMKIVTQGASLHNCEQGVSPLEITEDVYLKIFTNSTRPAKLNAKLGFQKNPGHLTIPLSSLLPDGGQISRINIIIVRLYPVLFMEKMQNGRYAVRNRRSEEKADLEYKRILEKKTEIIYDEVLSQIEKEVASKRSKLVLSHSQEDESMGQFKLTDSQELRKEMTAMVEEKLKKCLVKRNVTQFLRLKIVDLKKPDFMHPAVLTIWNPNEEIIRRLSEGKAMSVMNANFGNSLRNSNQIQINTTKQTQYVELIRHCDFPSRRLTSLESIYSGFTPYFDEADLVGITIMKNINCSSEATSNIFLVDLDCNFIRISPFKNYEDHCWESVLSHGSIVACSNLHWSGNSKKQEIPVFFVTETTVFTENPKHPHLQVGIQKLKEALPKDFHSFMSLCETELIKKLYK